MDLYSHMQKQVRESGREMTCVGLTSLPPYIPTGKKAFSSNEFQFL